MDHGIRYVTLQKMNDNQSFGFVIISSQNKAGATVGKSKKRIFRWIFLSPRTDDIRDEQIENSVIHKVWIGQIWECLSVKCMMSISFV